jgi:hypothetical protein
MFYVFSGVYNSFIPLACAEFDDSQELLPFLSVMYFFLPPFNTCINFFIGVYKLVNNPEILKILCVGK